MSPLFCQIWVLFSTFRTDRDIETPFRHPNMIIIPNNCKIKHRLLLNFFIPKDMSLDLLENTRLADLKKYTEQHLRPALYEKEKEKSRLFSRFLRKNSSYTKPKLDFFSKTRVFRLQKSITWQNRNVRLSSFFEKKTRVLKVEFFHIFAIFWSDVKNF